MTVSIALIVRDEEHTLSRCLDSLAGAVDEIVVVDTGSQDATLAVARRYTDQVHQFAWVQDFAAEAPPEVGAIYWPYVVAWDAYGHPTCRFWRERLVRNDGSYRWQGRVHEVLVSQHPWQTHYSDGVVVEHRPPRDQEHSRRNLDLLQAELAECRHDPPPRLLFYLGREYAACGQPQEALATLKQHLERCAWDEERYQSLLQVAAIHLEQTDGDSAIDTLLQALKVCPHWPDAYFGLARSYYFRQDWHKVVHWTEIGRAMPQPQTLLFTNPMDYRFNWMIYYTNALYRLGELHEALHWTRQALALCPGDAMHRENLAFFKQAAEKAHG
jgi:tetratricopeptide (TPR) repeat protein